MKNIDIKQRINKNKLYSINEILPFLKQCGAPCSRPAFFEMKKKGIIDEKLLVKFGDAKNSPTKVSGSNLQKIINDIVKYENPLKGVYEENKNKQNRKSRT